MARRGKKLARRLRARILDWERTVGGNKGAAAYRKPGSRPGNYETRYGARP